MPFRRAAPIVLSLFLAAPLEAATATFTVTEAGGGVTLAANGAFTLDGLENFGVAFDVNEYLISTDPPGLGFSIADTNLFGIITEGKIGTGSFGQGSNQRIGPLTGGDPIAVVLNAPLENPDFFLSYIVVPLGYENGTPLANSIRLPDTTNRDLGLIPGTYRYEIGPNAITVTVAPVPLPAAGLGLAAALGLLGAARLTRRAGSPETPRNPTCAPRRNRHR